MDEQSENAFVWDDPAPGADGRGNEPGDSQGGAESNPPYRPYFVPAEVRFEDMSEEFRAAWAELVEPLYQELVLDAQDALERSLGASFVTLQIAELHEQFELGRRLVPTRSQEGTSLAQRQAALNALLRLAERKVDLLRQFQAFRRRQTFPRPRRRAVDDNV